MINDLSEQQGFAIIPNSIIRAHQIPKSEKLVLMAILSYAGSESRETFVSQARLAKELGMKTDTVRKAIKWLANADLLNKPMRGKTRSWIQAINPKLDAFMDRAKPKKRTGSEHIQPPAAPLAPNVLRAQRSMPEGW